MGDWESLNAFGEYPSLSKELWATADIQKKMGKTLGQSIDKETIKAMTKSVDNQELMDVINQMFESQETDPYNVAEIEMNKQLKKKGLPSMEKILEVFYEARPEYEL